MTGINNDRQSLRDL